MIPLILLKFNNGLTVAGENTFSAIYVTAMQLIANFKPTPVEIVFIAVGFVVFINQLGYANICRKHRIACIPDSEIWRMLSNVVRW